MFRLVLIAVVSAVLFHPRITTAADRPNIIVIVADDLGYGDIGVHGCRDIPTPHIDSLAANGVRFTSGYVSGPYCSPTRAGLLTGRYQQRFGHEFNPGGDRSAEENAQIGLSPEEKTLPQRLKSAGYETAMVGKWHLGDAEKFHPLNRGFDSFVGFLGGAHAYLPPRANAATQRANQRQPIFAGRETVADYGYTTDFFSKHATAYVKQSRDKPFFLYLAFNAVHTPMHATPAKLKQFEQIRDEKRRIYAAMLSSMDDAIGSVLTALREKQIENDTLIFFISDNGGPERANASDNGPLSGGKATTWEGGIRVPFIVQWKGRVPAGKTYDHAVIQLDILPTCLAAAAVESLDKFDGVNLLPFVERDNAAVPHETLFWRFGSQMAIRQGNWKLVRAGAVRDSDPDATPEQIEGAMLFALAKDPGEATDLAAQNPAVVKSLTATWNAWNAELQPPAWQPRSRRR